MTGTSTEFLGRKPLPRAVRYRPLVFLFGPSGVGKTRVAQHLLPDSRVLGQQALLDTVTQRVRKRRWSGLALTAPALIMEGPQFLCQRVGYAKALRELLLKRSTAGRRTFVLEPSDSSGLKELVDAVPPEQRATVVLRFPVGRGRRRYAVRVCKELGIDTCHARAAAELEPWTYESVDGLLRRLGAEDIGTGS